MFDLLERLQMQHPIILAPMAGGPGTPELVAAVSNAGALGSFGAAYLGADDITAAVQRIRELARLGLLGRERLVVDARKLVRREPQVDGAPMFVVAVARVAVGNGKIYARAFEEGLESVALSAFAWRKYSSPSSPRTKPKPSPGTSRSITPRMPASSYLYGARQSYEVSIAARGTETDGAAPHSSSYRGKAPRPTGPAAEAPVRPAGGG